MMEKVKKTIRFIPLFLIAALLFSSTSCSVSEAAQSTAPVDETLDIEGSGKGVASCDAIEMLGFCYDYVGPGWTQEKIDLDCGFVEENYLQSEACSRQSLVATCNFDLQGNPDLAIVYYFYEPTDTTSAERMCPGTFIPAE